MALRFLPYQQSMFRSTASQAYAISGVGLGAKPKRGREAPLSARPNHIVVGIAHISPVHQNTLAGLHDQQTSVGTIVDESPCLAVGIECIFQSADVIDVESAHPCPHEGRPWPHHLLRSVAHPWGTGSTQ